jgi:hypothetical protein
MFDQLFSVIRLPLNGKQFHQLPRNPAYKYEYFDNAAWLSPRPKFYGARLTLRRPAEGLSEEIEVHNARIRFRPLADHDWPRLSRVFAGSFHRVQPFESLSDRRRLEAARDCLKNTRAGHDGPIIHPACHVAISEKDGRPIGAVLVTLVPPVDLDDFWGLRWKSPPPADCVEQRMGHPHLTWIFVSHWFAGYGVGSALLAHASSGLIELGYTALISSFILGNESSMLWHWRNGFDLLPYSGSRRRFCAMMRAKEREARDEAGTHSAS